MATATAMSLDNVRRGKRLDPPRLVIYGEHGLGKSTFAAQAPAPIFIPTEDGLDNIDTTSFPLATEYQQVLDAIAVLYTEEHEFQTVVVDSLDWLERLIWAAVARKHEHESIEEFGYGKGYIFALDLWREVLAGLNALRVEQGMAVILTSHCEVKRFDDPTSEPYDRYQLKLHKSASALVQEWADCIGFAAQKFAVKKEDAGFNKKVARAVSAGGHVLYFERRPAFDAKNRYGLPETLPLEWAAFAEALAASTSDNETD